MHTTGCKIVQGQIGTLPADNLSLDALLSVKSSRYIFYMKEIIDLEYRNDLNGVCICFYKIGIKDLAAFTKRIVREAYVFPDGSLCQEEQASCWVPTQI